MNSDTWSRCSFIFAWICRFDVAVLNTMYQVQRKKLNNPNADDKNTCVCLSLADQRAHTVSFDSVRAMFCSYSRYFIYLFSLRCDVPLLLIFLLATPFFHCSGFFLFIHLILSLSPFSLTCVCVYVWWCSFVFPFFSTIFPTGNIFFIIRGASTDHVFFSMGVCAACQNCIQLSSHDTIASKSISIV